jgi:hypothetical protein
VPRGDSREPDPVRQARETPELRHVLERACLERGLSPAGARLIHRYGNAVYLVPAEQAVARIVHGSARRARLSHSVAGWLVAQRGIAATAPLAGAPPVEIGQSTVVGFWTYYPQPATRDPPTSAHLARVLRQLHAIEAVPFELDPWEPLASLSAALSDPVAAATLAPSELDWLRRRVEEVRAEVVGLTSPLGHGVIHGDAWAGNLLWHTGVGRDAVVLGDWDGVSLGPREVDLIPSWHAAIRYGRGEQWASAFAGVYGYDLSAWEGFGTLLAMRDLVQLTGPLRRARDSPQFKAALRQRLNGIRNGDLQATWRAL